MAMTDIYTPMHSPMPMPKKKQEYPDWLVALAIIFDIACIGFIVWFFFG